MIASALWAHGESELVLLGGRVRRGSPDLVGPATELMIERLTADVAFLGSDGVDTERGSFAADIEAARVAERMAASTQRVVVVADSSKLGVAGAARYITIDELDELITERGAPLDAVRALRRRGVKVTLV
jgi:DeoR/GlpR family transcriptional regulator of sugar metabolism